MFINFDKKKKEFKVDDQLLSPGSVLSTSWLLKRIESAKPFVEDELLDIGCGTKPYEQLLGAKRHIGIDRPGSRRALSFDVFGKAELLPFADASFKTVLCTEVLEHLAHPDDAVLEMARVLIPGGCLVLSTPFFHQLHEVPHDYFRFTPFGIRSLLERVGLEVEEIWPRGGHLTVLSDLFFRWFHSLLRALFRKIAGNVKLQKIVTKILIIIPQKICARVLINQSVHGRRSQILERVDNPSTVTLGYVVVARRIETAES